MILRGVPLPRWSLLVLFIGTVVLVFFHSFPITGWVYADWVATSAEARQAFLLTGMLVAGISAWTSTTFGSTRSIVASMASHRRGAQLVLAQTACLWCVAFAGFTVGLLPTIVFTWVHASEGHPNALVLASGVFALAFTVGLGYALGVVLPRLLAVPAALVVALLLAVGSSTNGSVWALSWPFGVEAGINEVDIVAALRIALFAAGAATGVIVSAYWLTAHSGRVSLRQPLSASLYCLPLAAIVFAASTTAPAAIRPALDTVPSCRSQGVVQICVHPAREVMLEPLSAGVGRIFDLLGPSVANVSAVNDATLWRDQTPGVINLQLQGEDSDGWLIIAVEDLAREITGAGSCEALSGRRQIGNRPMGSVVADAVAAWLAVTAGPERAPSFSDDATASLANDLMRREPEQVTQILNETLSAIRDCRGTRAMFK